MPEKNQRDTDLASFLEQDKRESAGTWFETELDPELREQIIASGSRKWSAINRWLQSKGVDVPVSKLSSGVNSWRARHPE